MDPVTLNIVRVKTISLILLKNVQQTKHMRRDSTTKLYTAVANHKTKDRLTNVTRLD